MADCCELKSERVLFVCLLPEMMFEKVSQCICIFQFFSQILILHAETCTLHMAEDSFETSSLIFSEKR